MAEESQLGLHRLLAAAESESLSTSETSLSGDEGTSFLETDEKEEQAFTEKEGDVEKGGNTPLHSQKKNKKHSLHFFAWTIVNTLATIGIVGLQSRM
jgi:hypothetical protein